MWHSSQLRHTATAAAGGAAGGVVIHTSAAAEATIGVDSL